MSTTLILIIVNVIFSWIGFRNPTFYEQCIFEIDKILVLRDYKRLLTSGFLHADWRHLVMNMFSLLLFSNTLEGAVGSSGFLLIYFCSLLGGSLFMLFVHRYQSDYRALGASGAVCGVIFAAIAYQPDMMVFLWILPVPGWIFGIGYVLYTIMGMFRRSDNIGHDAHLSGGVTGMLLMIAMRPYILPEHPVVIAAILLPVLVVAGLLIRNPHILLTDSSQKAFMNIDQRYNAARTSRRKEVDALLEKIHEKGINSLTQAERNLLDEYSQEIN
ncbi:rhomboid family protein [Chitinophaga vietnamensis]|uniref:rhomboid family protein n=1 Tax=Chitinophaga vietnamensis TaxID=2593957 RepID=UPI001177B33E|nr:rhomboid family intramembrane serine protease [Chitinophaga vietnamensis]